MIDKKKFYAVITGDIVGSSKFKANQWEDILSVLKNSWAMVDEIFPGSLYAPFGIFRGDGFQGILSDPEKALAAAIIIRSCLRTGITVLKRHKAVDARMVIGIGTIDFLPEERVAEGRGEAYSNSGPFLDKMKGDPRLLIRVPGAWDHLNREFDTECALLDVIINKWSEEQAQVMLYHFKGFTQERMAAELEITQPAVRSRLKGAGEWGIDIFVERYKQQISRIISPGAYNGKI
jgi:hypothetical protein